MRHDLNVITCQVTSLLVWNIFITNEESIDNHLQHNQNLPRQKNRLEKLMQQKCYEKFKILVILDICVFLMH